jgi:hypothetical protein
MKFHMKSDVRAKKCAQNVRDELNKRSHPIKLSKAYEVVAHMYGYATWNALRGSLGKGEPSSDDSQIPAEDAAARRLQHINALIGAGVAEQVAQAVVDAVRPTEGGLAKLVSPEQRLEIAEGGTLLSSDEIVAAVLAHRPDAESVRKIAQMWFAHKERWLEERWLEELGDSDDVRPKSLLLEVAMSEMSLADLAATIKGVAQDAVEAGPTAEEVAKRKGAIFGHRTQYGKSLVEDWHRRMWEVARRCPHVDGRRFCAFDDHVRSLGLRWDNLGPNGFDLNGTVSALQQCHAAGGTMLDLLHVLFVASPTADIAPGSYAAGAVASGDDGRGILRSCLGESPFEPRGRQNLDGSEFNLAHAFGTPLAREVYSAMDRPDYDEFVAVYRQIVYILHWFDETEAGFMFALAEAAGARTLVEISSSDGGKLGSDHGIFLAPDQDAGSLRPDSRIVNVLGEFTVREYADFLAVPVDRLTFRRLTVARSADDRKSDALEAAESAFQLAVVRHLPWFRPLIGDDDAPALSAGEAFRMFRATYPIVGRTMIVDEKLYGMASEALSEHDPLRARERAMAFWWRAERPSMSPDARRMQETLSRGPMAP